MFQEKSDDNAGCGCFGFILFGLLLCFLEWVYNSFTQEIHDTSSLLGTMTMALFIAFIKTSLYAGFLWGAYLSIWHVVSSIAKLRKGEHRKASSQADNPERSVISYMYWKGPWAQDWGYLCSSNFGFAYRTTIFYASSTWRTTVRSRDRMRLITWLLALIPTAAFHICRTIITSVSIVCIISVVLLCFFVVSFVCVVIVNIIALMLNLMERILGFIQGFYLLCHSCNQHINLPHYRCSNERCRNVHRSLLPSAKYGIFYRRCNCGAKIPTSRFWGRSLLQASCPHSSCQAPLLLDGERTAACTIALIGGRSSGKTFLMAALLKDLIEKLPYRSSAQVEYNAEDSREIQSMLSAYDRAAQGSQSIFGSTSKGQPRAHCLDIKPSFFRTKRRLYLYDPAGEIFQRVTEMASPRYYQYLRAAVIVIDPFALTQLKGICSYDKIRSSSDDPFSVVSTWFVNIREKDFSKRLKKGACAVVIAKTDVEELQQKWPDLYPGTSREACRKFLINHSLTHIVNDAENCFRKVGYFAVSSIKVRQDGRQSYNPQGIDELVNWLMKNAVT